MTRLKAGIAGGSLLALVASAPILIAAKHMPAWLVLLASLPPCVLMILGVCVFIATAFEMLFYAITGTHTTKSIWD